MADNTTNNIVAYIDLLAFSNHVRENTSDALMAMNNYNTIISTKLRDELINLASSYPIELQQLAKNHSIDSFDYFLPFSDSVFLMSSKCSSFIKQLGSFVLQSFTISSHFYSNPIDPSHPEKNYINNYSIDSNGQLVVHQDFCNYYPALFRGGLAYGEAFPIELLSVIDKKSAKSKVLTGSAVVDAVRLESKVKGPRLLFRKDVFDQLDGDAKVYCRILPEENGLFEILWPALIFIKQNEESQDMGELSKMYELIVPAFNLWKAYNHTLFSAHYFNFIELIVAATIQWFDKQCGLKDFAVSKISDWMNKNELKDKMDLGKY